MKVKELIEKYKKLEGVWDAPGAETARQIFLQDLEQLDEPQKVVVPKFVADWYEENKDAFEANLYRCAYNIPSVFDGAKLNEFERWFLTAGTKPFQTLVNMHQFGYTIKKYKRYRVEMKGIHSPFRNLKYNLLTKKWYMGNDTEDKNVKKIHTRKELEDAGFGEVFNSPLFEIEEVE